MRCIVPGCDHDSSQDMLQSMTLQLLPVEPWKRASWLKELANIGRESSQSAGVCSCHFQPADLYVSHGRWRLRRDVPGLEQIANQVFDCIIKPCCVKMERLQGTNRLEDVSMSSRLLKACRVCLATDSRLYVISMYESLARAYEILTGISTKQEEHLPRFVCSECAQRLVNFMQFRNRSLRTRMVLAEIAKKHNSMRKPRAYIIRLM